MSRLQRATFPARVLSILRRNAVPTMCDVVEVDLRVKAPISPDLRRLLESARYSKGASGTNADGHLTFRHPVKTCYSDDFPGFARSIVVAMRQARCEGRSIEIVRYK